MAYLFQLSIECGADEKDATACAGHFGDWQFQLADETSVAGATVQFHDDGDDAGAWWVLVTPSNVSRIGTDSAEDAAKLTLAGHALLERLKSAPPFRFALVGVETEYALSFQDVQAGLSEAPGFAASHHGLVVAGSLAKLAQDVLQFEPFAEGAAWIAYRGETAVGA